MQYKKQEVNIEATFRPRPRLEDEPVSTAEFVPPMYFTSPSQLLDVFTEMEESNLFLIQHGQASRVRASLHVSALFLSFGA